MTINERVKAIRKAKSLTMEAFGEKMGVGKTAISKIESGERGVTSQMASSIIREFHVNEAWLRDGEGEMFAPEPVDAIDSIVREYGLNEDSRIMIQQFITLPEASRQVILDYIRSVVDAMNADDAAAPTEESFHMTPEEISRQIDLEQEARAESSASQDTGSAGSGEASA